MAAPDSISLGGSAIIDVYAENNGGSAGDSSTISVSFPTLDETDDDGQVEIRTNTLSARNVVTRGGTIHMRTGGQATAQYALVEGSTGSNTWESGEENRLSVSVTPEQAGTFTIYVRVSLTDDDDITEKFVAPESGAATDQQNYVVKKITMEVTKPKEGILVFPKDEDGEAPSNAVVGVESTTEDRAKIKELSDSPNCVECASFKDSFVSPGTYTILVKHGSVYWGWRETTVEKGEVSAISFDRGGSWVRGTHVSAATTSSGTPRVPPGDTIPLSLDLYQANHGSRTTINLYVHEQGTSRSGTPTRTITRRLNDGSNSIDVELDAPNEEGTYVIDYTIDTYFPGLDGGRLTDTGSTGTVQVEAYEPPKIETAQPSTRDLTVNPSKSPSFSVSVSDPDTPSSRVDVRWFVDGTKVVSSTEFNFDPSTYSAGEHEVTAVVDDGSSRTTNVRASWTVSVAKPPKIQSTSPNDATASPGRPVQFSMSATDPNGYSLTNYSWRIRGKHLVGKDVTYTFQQTGTFTIRATVTNTRGLSTTKTFEIDVTGTGPKITNVRPKNSTFAVDESAEFGVSAVDPAGRNVSFSYRWIIDGEEAFTTRTGTRSFNRAGSHTAKVIVTNQFGSKTTKSFDFRVANDKPELERLSPSGENTKVQSKQTVRLAARVINADTSDVSVKMLVDGNSVREKTVSSTSSKVAFQTQFENPGEHTVTLAAKDGEGASASITWDVRVTSRAPVFDNWAPSQTDLGGLTPVNRTFSAAAHDPEGQGVSYEWYVDGSYVSDGKSLERRFTKHGTYTVSVRAIDPQGVTKEHSWRVNAKSFNVAPKVRKHATENTVVVGNGSTTFLTVTMRNPKANNRTMKVAFVTDLPDGLAIRRMANVQAASSGNAVGYGTLQPGEQKSMRIGVFVKDEELRGETVQVDYAVRYYPVGQKRDYHSVLDKSTQIEFVGEQSQASNAVAVDGSTGTSTPGFTPVTVVAALVLCGVGAVVRRRL